MRVSEWLLAGAVTVGVLLVCWLCVALRSPRCPRCGRSSGVVSLRAGDGTRFRCSDCQAAWWEGEL